MVWFALLGFVALALLAADMWRYARRRRRGKRQKQRRIRNLAYEYAWNRVMRRPLNPLLTDQRGKDEAAG